MGYLIPYQEWQITLVPVYLSQQLTNYDAHQFSKQCYRPELLKDDSESYIFIYS